MSTAPLPASNPPKARDVSWVAAQSVLFIALVVAGPAGAGAWHHPSMVLMGGLLFTLGGVVGLAGVAVLGRNRTPFPRPRAGSRLVVDGIYGWVRHPLYLSVLLAGLGWSLLWQSLAALVVTALLAPFLDAKARHEERWLRSAFPGYPDYARRVRRFLPGVY